MDVMKVGPGVSWCEGKKDAGDRRGQINADDWPRSPLKETAEKRKKPTCICLKANLPPVSFRKRHGIELTLRPPPCVTTHTTAKAAPRL